MPNIIALASEPIGFATSRAPKARPHFLTSGASRDLTLAPSGASRDLTLAPSGAAAT